MTSIRADLRALPLWLAVGLVLVAAVVLLLRVVGLAVCVVVDSAERCEAALTGAVGIAPLAASVLIFSADLTAEEAWR